MKKGLKIILKVIIYVIAFIVGGFCGFMINAIRQGDTDMLTRLLETLFSIFIAYNINVIIHEGGHLVFGLLCGYRFCSFRVWSFMLVRQNGRFRLCRHKLMGTGGQCLMIPPKHGETRASVILYNLGGIIFNLIFAVLCFALNNILPEIYILSTFLWMNAVLSIIALLTNGIPLNIGGIANDGMNALHLSQNPDAAEAFRKTLLINAAQTEGMRISEMPDEWFRLPDGADMQNIHCASLAVFSASRPLESGDTVAAEQEITKLLASDYNIIGLHRHLLTCDLIYAKLINDPTVDISYHLSPMLSKVMQSMKNYPSIIRTQHAVALLSAHTPRGHKNFSFIILPYHNLTLQRRNLFQTNV